QEILHHLKQILSQEITENINDSVLMNFIKISPEEREEGKKVFLASLTDVFENGVRTENMKSTITEVKDTIKYSTMNDQLKSGLNNLTDFAIVENSFFDVVKTAEARREEESNVVPVVIRACAIILRDGKTIFKENKYSIFVIRNRKNYRCTNISRK